MTATTKTARPPHGLIFQLKYGVTSSVYAYTCPARKPCKHIAGVQKFERMSAHLDAARKERDIARF